MFRQRLQMVFIATAMALTACTTPFVNPPILADFTPAAGAGTASGAAVGVVAGSASGSVLAGTAIGALVGLGIGSYSMSTAHLLRTLQCEGVQVVQIGQYVRIIMPADLLFEFNSATIRNSAVPALDTVLLFMSRYGTVPLTITGYSDNVLPTDTAMLLTSRQAKSVAAYFWSHGIPFNMVYPIGRGSESSIASNGNSIGSYYNRRIEITFKSIPLHQNVDWSPGAG